MTTPESQPDGSFDNPVPVAYGPGKGLVQWEPGTYDHIREYLAQLPDTGASVDEQARLALEGLHIRRSPSSIPHFTPGLAIDINPTGADGAAAAAWLAAHAGEYSFRGPSPADEQLAREWHGDFPEFPELPGASDKINPSTSTD